ncbi:MAG: SH3 domain-containing protein [Bauldia sp.]|nr:SH3 domain-containing protein [Bauldia sp.]
MFFRLLSSALTLAAIIALPTLGSTAAKADPVVPFEEHCVVNVRTNDVLNIRSGPGTFAPIVAIRAYGTCGIVVTGDPVGSWYPIDDGHYAGWVHKRYIAMVSPALYCVTNVAWNDVLNLRAWPTPQSQILVGLAPNQCGIAFLPYATGTWQKVRVAGWEGWVNRNYVSGQ